jgi:drug/metabolite transporter (DMT)-like permease
MSPVVLGALAACAASSMYNLGVALQAIEAREVPPDRSLRPTLVARLARRPRWLAGTALGVLGWPLQAAALLLAPLTVVQPALAFGLTLLLVLGVRTLGEHVGTRDVAAVLAIVAGVGGLAAVAPDVSSQHRGGWTLAGVLAGLAAFALAPYVARGGPLRTAPAAAVAAGAAFAWSGLSTKFVADALSTHQWLLAVVWTVATGLASGLALLSEMSALQRRAATHVAPVVFVVQVVIPVLAAPLLTGESWAHAPLGPAGIVAGLAVVVGGAVLLITAPAVRSLVDAEPISDESVTGRTPRSDCTAASVRPADAASMTTMSPGAGATGAGSDASTVSRPEIGEASSLRARRYWPRPRPEGGTR